MLHIQQVLTRMNTALTAKVSPHDKIVITEILRLEIK